MAQTGRNQRQLVFDNLREFRTLASRAHIAARFAHRPFRLRDRLSHMCSLVDLAVLRQRLGINPIVVQFVGLASAGIAVWM